jgi:hypothetical protein
MVANDISERLGLLEQLVRYLYLKTGVEVPPTRRCSPKPKYRFMCILLLASGDKVGAIQAYRDEANVDLTTASRVIDAL